MKHFFTDAVNFRIHTIEKLRDGCRPVGDSKLPEQIKLPTFDELIALSDQASEYADKWEFADLESDEKSENQEEHLKQKIAA